MQDEYSAEMNDRQNMEQTLLRLSKMMELNGQTDDKSPAAILELERKMSNPSQVSEMVYSRYNLDPSKLMKHEELEREMPNLSEVHGVEYSRYKLDRSKSMHDEATPLGLFGERIAKRYGFQTKGPHNSNYRRRIEHRGEFENRSAKMK